MQNVLTEELFDYPEEQQENPRHEHCTGALEKKKEILPLMTGGEANEPQKLDLNPLPVELKVCILGRTRIVPSCHILPPQQSTGKQPVGHP